MESEFREMIQEVDYTNIYKKLIKWLIKYGGHSPYQSLIEDLFCRIDTDEIKHLISDLLYSPTYEPLRTSFQKNKENATNTT